MLTVHPSSFQQPQNSNLPLNALGSLGSQLPCGPAAQTTLRATPPPNASASLQPQQQQHHASAQAQVPPRPPTPASAGGPSSTPTHVPSSLPGPPSAMSTPPEPPLPLTPLQPQTEPPSQMQQPTSVQAQHPSTPVRYPYSTLVLLMPLPAPLKVFDETIFKEMEMTCQDVSAPERHSFFPPPQVRKALEYPNYH